MIYEGVVNYVYFNILLSFKTLAGIAIKKSLIMLAHVFSYFLTERNMEKYW